MKRKHIRALGIVLYDEIKTPELDGSVPSPTDATGPSPILVWGLRCLESGLGAPKIIILDKIRP